MKRLLLILIIGFYSLTCYSQEIFSTEKGGDWNNPKTWINEKIPNLTSNVVIQSNVVVKEPISCTNIRILKEGILEFIQTQDSLNAIVSEIINIEDGEIIIRENWKLSTERIIKTDPAKIENYGIITVGR